MCVCVCEWVGNLVSEYTRIDLRQHKTHEISRGACPRTPLGGSLHRKGYASDYPPASNYLWLEPWLHNHLQVPEPYRGVLFQLWSSHHVVSHRILPQFRLSLYVLSAHIFVLEIYSPWPSVLCLHICGTVSLGYQSRVWFSGYLRDLVFSDLGYYHVHSFFLHSHTTWLCFLSSYLFQIPASLHWALYNRQCRLESQVFLSEKPLLDIFMVYPNYQWSMSIFYSKST